MAFKKLTIVFLIVSLFSPIQIFGLASCEPFCGGPSRDAVIVIPGIGGSWNWDTMLHDIRTDDWDFTVGIKTYNDLIQAFENEGYVRDKDLFVAFYDWRRDNLESARNYLIPVINRALLETPTGRVDIVAHSMGGLVARSYIQSDDYRFDVDQLVTLGTPNKGSSDSYLLWEGGELPTDWSPVLKYAVGAYLRFLGFQSSPPELSKAITVRNHIPSVRQLLPVYDFLVDKDTGDLIPYGSLSETNEFLADLNSNISDDLMNKGVLITTISGDDLGTINQIPVVERNFLDQLTGRWADGKPDPNPPNKDSTEGDNRVLLSSSEILGSVAQTLANAKHDRLPTIAQQDVVEIIAGTSPLAYFDTPEPESVLGVMAASPVIIQITDPNGNIISQTINEIPGAEFDAEDDPQGAKMILIPNPLDGEYKIDLLGNGNGVFHLITGFADEDSETSEVEEGQVTENESISYILNLNSNQENPIETEVLDETPPAVEIVSPVDNSSHIDTEILPLQLTGSDDQSGLQRLDLFFDGNLTESTTTTSTLSRLLDLSLIPLGNHTVKGISEDNAGNTAEQEVSFESRATFNSTIANIQHYEDLGLLKVPLAVKLTLIGQLQTVKIMSETYYKTNKPPALKKIINAILANLAKRIADLGRQKKIDPKAAGHLRQAVESLKAL